MTGSDRTRIRTTWSWVRVVVLVACAGVGFLLFAPTRFGGQTTYAVVTGHSMEPTMHDGALAIARKRTGYQLGDAVIYERYGGHVMHRLVYYEADHGWVSRGDNNPWVDGWFIPEENINGEVIIAVPYVGGWVRSAARNPAYAAGAAALATLLTFLPHHRRKVTPALSNALADSVSEPVPKRPHGGSRTQSTITATATVMSLVAAIVSMVRQAPVWPVQATTLTALVLCAFGFDYIQTLTQDARGVAEPDRSTLVLADCSRRWFHECPPDESATPGRVPVHVGSAMELRDLAETYRLPVLHRVDPRTGHRDYVLITSAQDYVWVPPAGGPTAHPPAVDSLRQRSLVDPRCERTRARR